MDSSITIPRGPHATSPGCSFTLPPLDGSLTLIEMYDFHYERNKNYPVFLFPNTSGGQTKVLYSDFVPAIHRAGRFGARLANIEIDNAPLALPTIAILASSDTITYITTVLGLIRAGMSVFVIAPRCSPLAVASLLSNVKPDYLLVSQESSIRQLAEAGIVELKSFNPEVSPPKICSMPTIETLYAQDAAFEPLPPFKQDWSVPRLMMHSSGSTALPKPITWNDRVLFQLMLQSKYSSRDLCGEVLAGQAFAMFHSVSWVFILMTSVTGIIIATFQPASPATVPSPEAVFQGIVATSATWGFFVPSFIEEWSTDEEKLESLRRLKFIGYCGGPLNKGVGDKLTRHGVTLLNGYGTTEVGCISTFIYDLLPPLDWEYFYCHPDRGAKFTPVDGGAYMITIVESPTCEIAVVNSTYEGKNAHTVSDLLVPHPTKPNTWKFIGRSDDQIVLSTGEKTNPAELESLISQDSLTKATVMFGNGRLQVGVIVELKTEFAFDPSDEVKLAEFRNHLWPRIEEMNAIAPNFSRLYKEMVLVSRPSKPFSYTGKRTVRKAAVIKEYEPEINALYDTLEQMAQVEPPKIWTAESSLLLVRSIVESVLQRSLKDTEDMFEAGCDSLQATWIRNSCTQTLRKTPNVKLDNISIGFVYENPTVASLSKYVLSVVRGELADGSREADELLALVDNYTSSFPKHVPTSTAVDGEVFLVSGTTGSLGSAVLAVLVATESVRKVFAFNRPSSKPIVERQKEALKSRGYDPEIAISPKVTLVEGKLDGSGLGVDPVLEDEIRQSVTHIVHIAWRVDFNISLASFKSAIGGIRTLVDLALSSPQPKPPRISFTSSIGALMNLKSVAPVADVLVDEPSICLGQGYSESKWISERILAAAAKVTPLRSTILRVGQVCGGINGNWNTSDWVPAIIKSSLTLGCLPELKGFASWIPLHLAAQTIVDIQNEEFSVVNLVHPRPIPCKDLLQVFSEELSLPLVPFAEWEAKLEHAAAEVANLKDSTRISAFASQLPAAVLLDFFKGALEADKAVISHESEVLGLPTLMTENARKSDMFRNASSLEAQDVRMWLRYWKDIGFIMC